jgi:thioredoxin 1
LPDGRTPLLVAAHDGHTAVVQLLLHAAGLLVNRADDKLGVSAIMVASQRGHTEVVRLLLAVRGIVVDRAARNGKTALCSADEQGHFEIVRLLVGHASRQHVLRLADDAVGSLPGGALPGGLLSVLPDLCAQAAALRLPLGVAASLGETERERAAADLVAVSADHLRFWTCELEAAAAAATPGARDKARRLVPRACTAGAARGAHTAPLDDREMKLFGLDSECVGPDAVFTLLRAIVAGRMCRHSEEFGAPHEEAALRGAGLGDAYLEAWEVTHMKAFELAQAEHLAALSLRLNGKPWRDRLRNATLAISAAIAPRVAAAAAAAAGAAAAAVAGKMGGGVTMVADKAAFQKVLAQGKPVVVHFYATWCGPCKMIAPKIEELSVSMRDVIFVKIDVDQAEELEAEMEVRAMPTFMFFTGGNKVDNLTVVGASIDKINVVSSMLFRG